MAACIGNTRSRPIRGIDLTDKPVSDLANLPRVKSDFHPRYWHGFIQVLSSTGAVGPLVLTDWMPFSMAAVLEYISLLPMICPLPALRTK
jgi:hypothetical protein